ncbi:MAG: hypothetical protein JWM49_2045 [Microbacteriaceae bacterium]|nr:hypothetical protein [Microbacteriaceae bacterium]
MISAVRAKRKLVVGVVASAALLAIAAVVTVIQVGTAMQLPPKDSSAEKVLRVYLRAAKAHNCAVTEALSDGSDERSVAWCGGRSSSLFSNHPDLLAYKNIGSVSRVSASEDGGVAEECIQVDVTETNMNGAAPGALPGWQFCFDRTSSGWRLTNEGYG